MSELVFRLGGLGLYVAYMMVRGVNERRLKRPSKFDGMAKADTQDRLELWVIGVGSLPLPVYMFSSWLDFASMGLPDAVRWLGGAIAIAGIGVFAWTHAVLSNNWTPFIEPPPGGTLITRGPYKWVRHPMYSSFFLFNGGLWLFTSNWLAGGAAFATFAWMYLHRVGREERMMLEQFGDEYRAYAQTTGRVVPFMGRGRLAEQD